jgi:hypothetical protein
LRKSSRTFRRRSERRQPLGQESFDPHIRNEAEQGTANLVSGEVGPVNVFAVNALELREDAGVAAGGITPLVDR